MQSSGIRVRISDLLFALQKRWMVIVSLTLVGLTFGLILSAMTFIQSSFQSFQISGSYAITTLNANGLYINNSSGANNNDFHLAEDMMEAVMYVIRSDRVMGEVIEEQQLLGYSESQLRSAISISQYNATQIVEMRFYWRNAEEGIAIWNSIVEHVSTLLPKVLQLGSLAVINEPAAVLVSSGGSGSSIPVLITLLGFAAGVGFAVIELLMHPTLNNVRDVEGLFGLETLGVVPRDDDFFKWKRNLLVENDVGSSRILQNYSAAAYILRNRLGMLEKHQCFYVTSAIAQEGKTTVAANLAIQLSDMEHRTLLIDFDTRNPSLGSLFLEKVDYSRTLNALYRGDATEEDAVITLTGYLDLIPMMLEHNAIPMDRTIIELIERLKQKYDYVILDAPPVGVVSDTLSLNQVASTVLFVIGYDQSTIPEIQSSLEKLDKTGIRVLGCIVNRVQDGRQSLGKKQGGKKKDKAKEQPQENSPKENEGTPEELNELLQQNKQDKTGSQEAAKGGKKAGKVKKSFSLFKKVNKEASQPMPSVKEEETKALSGAVMPPQARNLMESLLNEPESDSLTDQEAADRLMNEAMGEVMDESAPQEQPSQEPD